MRTLAVGMLAMLISALSPGASSAAQNPPVPTPTPAAQGHTPTPTSGTRLRVYLECDCFSDYLRDEIEWVDFVRQPQDADVHLLSSSSSTGGGGRELVLRFVGVGRFGGTTDELRVISQTGEPELQRRDAVLRTVTVGLLHFMARGGLPAGLDLNVRVEAPRSTDVAPVRDRWNLWVFRLSADGSIDAEESNREMSWRFNASADRVTEMWKISFGASIDEERETFDLDEDDPFEVRQREREFDFFLARSLGPHWSFGVDGNVGESTFGNTRFSANTSAAVEYSIFPYRDYATRQFLVQYQIGPEHVKYREITLFDKIEETLWRHELSVNFDQRQPWGSLEFGAEWSQYLHDFSKYRLEVDGEVSVRLLRGLEFDISGSASRIRDQLSLPRRDATPTEVLLRLRELQSGYELSFSIGLSYSFGSIFNNVVNPRFGR
jgi:hypothetical protein